jgi:hypothetical protein
MRADLGMKLNSPPASTMTAAVSNQATRALRKMGWIAQGKRQAGRNEHECQEVPAPPGEALRVVHSAHLGDADSQEHDEQDIGGEQHPQGDGHLSPGGPYAPGHGQGLRGYHCGGEGKPGHHRHEKRSCPDIHHSLLGGSPANGFSPR